MELIRGNYDFKVVIDREYVVMRGLRSDFVLVVLLLDWRELLYEFVKVVFSHFWTFLDVFFQVRKS